MINMQRIDRQKIFNKKINDYGYMTIEASFVIAVIITAIFVVIMGFIFTYERSYLISKEYKGLYSIPINNIRNNKVENYLESIDFKSPTMYGEVNLKGAYRNKKAEYKGELDLNSHTNMSVSREIDVCVDRLRRWQMYDDIAEESGD